MRQLLPPALEACEEMLHEPADAAFTGGQVVSQVRTRRCPPDARSHRHRAIQVIDRDDAAQHKIDTLAPDGCRHPYHHVSGNGLLEDDGMAAECAQILDGTSDRGG